MDEPLTRTEFLAYMDAFRRELTMPKKGRLMTRQEVIAEIKKTKYYRAVRKGYLTPLKEGTAKSSPVMIETEEFEQYLEMLKK